MGLRRILKQGRFAVVCIPGRAEDGSDATWYVLDRRTGIYTTIGDGDDKRDVALATSRIRNQNRKHQ